MVTPGNPTHEPDPILRTARLTLRPLLVADITPAYVAWLNDPVVTRYLEVRHTPQTEDAVRRYVAERYASRASGAHFGVFDCDGMRHVGTVTLNSLNIYHKTVDIAFTIGLLAAQGKGYATEALYAVCQYAFTDLGLHKLTGGHYASHTASFRVFQKNGFTVEGRRVEQVCNADGQREDVVLHGLVMRDFQEDPRCSGRGG